MTFAKLRAIQRYMCLILDQETKREFWAECQMDGWGNWAPMKPQYLIVMVGEFLGYGK